MSRRYLMVAVCLPLLLIAGSIVKAELSIRGPRSVRLPIEGYDPRDLWKGYYIRYRIRVDGGECQDAEDCCGCVTGGGDGSIARVERMDCSVARSCNATLEGAQLSEARRFYIPEEGRRERERRLRNAMAERQAAVECVVSDGEPHVRALWIGDERVGQR